jgi:hypothetical protein
MDDLHDRGSIADSGRDPLDRSAADIADGEDPGHAGLERER